MTKDIISDRINFVSNGTKRGGIMAVTPRIIEKLREVEMFSSVSPEILSSVLSNDEVEVVDYKKGEIIYSSEVYRASIGLILKGSARVLKVENGVMVSKLTEGDIFGCAVLFSGKEYFVNEITATKDTKVVYVGKGSILKLMQLEGNFSVEYIRYLSDRIYFLNKRIANFTGGSAESRLANYLLGCFADYKTYELDRSMSQLAVSLDIGRASLYRAFESLIESGAIQRNGKNIRLADKGILNSFIQ